MNWTVIALVIVGCAAFGTMIFVIGRNTRRPR